MKREIFADAICEFTVSTTRIPSQMPVGLHGFGEPGHWYATISLRRGAPSATITILRSTSDAVACNLSDAAHLSACTMRCDT